MKHPKCLYCKQILYGRSKYCSSICMNAAYKTTFIPNAKKNHTKGRKK